MDALESSSTVYRTESEGSTTSEDREGSLRAYLEKESLGHLTALFPDDVSLNYFQSLTEDDLEHDYNVKDDKERELLMHSIVKLREEFSAYEVRLQWHRHKFCFIQICPISNYLRVTFGQISRSQVIFEVVILFLKPPTAFPTYIFFQKLLCCFRREDIRMLFRAAGIRGNSEKYKLPRGTFRLLHASFLTSRRTLGDI